MSRFANKTAIITGGASGIGYALAQHNAGVFLLGDRSSKVLQERFGRLIAGQPRKLL